jgi:poly-gamma-glutamate synthesis protein (capsule biosynthesis protein)
MKIVALGQALIHEPVSWPEDLRDRLKDADAVICNFEGCLPTPRGTPMKSKTLHAAHPKALEMLRDLGVTHLALANNHAWDYGHSGLLETRARARAAGFAVAGVGATLADASAPAIKGGVALLSVDAGPTPDWAIADAGPGIAPLRLSLHLGLPQTDIDRLREISRITGAQARAQSRIDVGFDRARDTQDFYGLALTPAETPQEIWTPNAADLERLSADIAHARSHTDRVLVALHYHHWASDWSRPPDWLSPLGHQILRAGADAVLCTGPPFAYSVENVGPGVLAPSLGNLVFHTRRGAVYDRLRLPVWTGMVLTLASNTWTSAEVEALRPSTR